MVTLATPDDIVIVQVPAAWDPADVRREQRRIDKHLDEREIKANVVIVGGGVSGGKRVEFVDDTPERAILAESVSA